MVELQFKLVAVLFGLVEVIALEGQLLLEVLHFSLKCRHLLAVVLAQTLLGVLYDIVEPFLLTLHLLPHIPVIFTALSLQYLYLLAELLYAGIGPVEFLSQLSLLPLNQPHHLLILFSVPLLQLRYLLRMYTLHRLNSCVSFPVLTLVKHSLLLQLQLQLGPILSQ